MSTLPVPPSDPLELDGQLARQVEQWILSYPMGQLTPLQLFKLLQLLLDHIAQREPLHFTTTFSLMAYVCHKYHTPPATQQALHLFRKQISRIEATRSPDDAVIQEALAWGYRALAGTIRDIFNVSLHPAFHELLEQLPAVTVPVRTIRSFEPLVRMMVLRIDLASWQMTGFRDDSPGLPVVVQGNIPERNENFNELFESLARSGSLPMRINLVDVETDPEGILYPKGFVLQPDHLIDVTTVAECFTPGAAFPLIGVMKRFLPSLSNAAILAGHMANFFLDRLIQEPDLEFDALFPEVFKLSPLGFAMLSDQEVRELVVKGRVHFSTLQQFVQSGLSAQQIDAADCYLEPSFYSPDFGIQGRLDLFHLPTEREKAPGIIELKSGAPFRPNAYGLNANHYIQTLLYDLLIRDIRPHVFSLTYILYSREAERPLRFAPVVRSKQMDALQVRNQILLMEDALTRLDGLDRSTWDIFHQWNMERHPGLGGFHQRDLDLFSRTWQGLDEVEQAYFASFAGFLAREYQLAKTGRAGSDRWKGQASLWLDTRAEKADRFSILSFLRIIEDRSAESDPLIRFQFTPETPSLANFRVGDITILYPHLDDGQSTNDQLWKCTIVELGRDEIVIRLRAPQVHRSRFQQDTLWHLESDFLDSAFHQLTRSLFTFATAPKEKRDLLLGRIPPGLPAAVQPISLADSLTDEQQQVIRQLLSSKDYFLLWGPPGTGKTSVVLHHLVGWLYRNTSENLLLLAYTNRAVDEICSAIEALGSAYADQYVRIGSRYSTAEPYRERLLSTGTASCTSREEVRNLIGRYRIFVGTVSSMHGQTELLRMKRFDRVIIDEASQLLEPMLLGLLVQFPHVTLIGDHKQLPAVVTQERTSRAITAPPLAGLEITDAGTSLFERLILRSRNCGWSHAYGMLSRQGRMHEDLMVFPNDQFYEGKLQLIGSFQQVKLADPAIGHPLHEYLGNRRIAFLAVDREQDEPITKTNMAEARLIVDLFQYYRMLYHAAGRTWTEETLGVITPFKAQIALIRQLMDDAGIPADACTVDTVERYQGGAREIILISFCVQHPVELSMITSDGHGIDRKLNVALTRARSRLISVGNPEALSGHPQYMAYLDQYRLDIP